MNPGIKGIGEVVVTEELTAMRIGSGLLPVYATPMMIALMENTAANSVQPYL
jgi:predicted thioesterase